MAYIFFAKIYNVLDFSKFSKFELNVTSYYPAACNPIVVGVDGAGSQGVAHAGSQPGWVLLIL